MFRIVGAVLVHTIIMIIHDFCKKSAHPTWVTVKQAVQGGDPSRFAALVWRMSS
jgi:hypothetical protein